MKRFKFGRLTAIALALSVVACERSPQAEQLPPDSQSPRPSVSSEDNKRSEAASQPRDAASADFALSFPNSPQQSTHSQLGLATRYGKASLPNKTRPVRVVTAGRANPFHAVHQPRVEVTYESTAALSTQKPLAQEQVSVQNAPFPEVPRAQTVSQQDFTTPESVPAVAFGEPAPAVPAVVQPLPQPVALAPVPPTILPVPSVPPLTAPVAVPTSVPSVLPVSQTAIAEAIEIKGLIQVGEKFNLIIKDPAADTSRTVQVGDVIGGGRVTINRIDALDSQEPQVVLEQDGVEVVRSIGV